MIGFVGMMASCIGNKWQLSAIHTKPWFVCAGLWWTVSGCVSTEQQIDHYRHSTSQYYGETIAHTTHDRWTVNQQTPIDAAIVIAPGNTHAGVAVHAPKPPISQSTILYPSMINGPSNGDCYTMTPVIINGEQATVVKPCL